MEGKALSSVCTKAGSSPQRLPACENFTSLNCEVAHDKSVAFSADSRMN